MHILKRSDRGAYYDTVKMLLEAGADINQRDNFGRSALNYAQEIRPSEVEHYRKMMVLLKEWPEIQKQRRLADIAEQAEKHAQWLKDTDCHKGLEKPIRAGRPLNISPAANLGLCYLSK